MSIKKGIILIKFLFFLVTGLSAQNNINKKYPSLLWEISGNGLNRPSYVFGTMHVSNKMVFHLGDSFYNAIKRTDVVALEINPETWQEQMVRLENLKENYASFVQTGGNDFITENSFRINNYADELKLSLRTEPAITNNLLYRSYKSKEDFEEDTFLDLYIFQTGRRLGKKAAGVENYYEAEKIIMGAYADMSNEQKKKNNDLDAEFLNGYVEKIREAYRRGDLDLLDSMEYITEKSLAFREKFIYKRNEIQANSIDSIIKKTSLFAGIGAAHLPGNRGVIELLRKKGYILKPIQMAERNGTEKNVIDQLHVQVTFQKNYSDDKFYSVDVPGDLYKVRQDNQNLDRMQYADMSNGSYYLVTRVKTHATFLGQSEKDVLKMVDSILYENIPGKILIKKAIIKNNFNGYDITSKTRRGDMQRYMIFITPFEIIIFKMSGKENYINGKEAARFFSSITFKEMEINPLYYEPIQGGFSMELPHFPYEYFNTVTADKRWEYEAVDKTTGDAWLIFKKSICNYNFLEEDSFDLKLISESFRSPDYFEKNISSVQSTFKGYPELRVREKLKNGSFVHARYLINGPHYYVIAQRVSHKETDPGERLNSFSFKPINYKAPQLYTDTFLRAAVLTPVIPDIDGGLRSLVEQNIDAVANGNNNSGYIKYWQKPKIGNFCDDSTGECVLLQVQEYPKYFYIKDSLKYWQSEVAKLLNKHDMYIPGDIQYIREKEYSGINIVLKDTGSSRTVNHLLLMKNNFLYRLSTIGDTIKGNGDLGKIFFNTFRPEQNTAGKNIYENRVELFFSDLFGQDSVLQKKAQQAISNVYYGISGIPMIMNAINKLSLADKDYYNTKSNLINELGFIKDSTSDILVSHLKKIYEISADTGLFRNEVIKALARLKTKASFLQLKEFILSDPPIFENIYDYNSLFENFHDSLKLSVDFFPELLQLSSLDDYKEKVLALLVKLVDSGYVTQNAYEKYFSSIYIDAVVALKKQRSKEERTMMEAAKNAYNDDRFISFNYNDAGKNLKSYSVLLMPFYEKNKNVQNFFTRLLLSKDTDVKYNAVILMLRNNKPVSDSIIAGLAVNDRYCSTLFYDLKKINQQDRFPAKYKEQLNIVRSNLVKSNEFAKLDSIEFISKRIVNVKREIGYVYFFRYRVNATDQWRIGIAGLQPENGNEISTEFSIRELTNVKLKENESLEDQLNQQLKKIIFGFHKSTRRFFTGNDNYNELKELDD